MTQMDLALAADSSTRHLSYLETGKAQPSREMVLRLGAHLKISLRHQNALLLAAGFAPSFREQGLEDLESAHRAVAQILEAHKPYPGFAVDRHWNIILSNRALPELYVDCSPELLRPPVNAVRLMLHPCGLAPKIVNFAEWQTHIVHSLERQLESGSDEITERLLAEVLGYPSPLIDHSRKEEGCRRFATPLQIATLAGTLSFLSTTTVFGNVQDVTLSELALELLFPYDAETVAVVSSLGKPDGAEVAGKAPR